MKFPLNVFPSKTPDDYIDILNTTELDRMVVHKNSTLGNIAEVVAIGYKEESIYPYLVHKGRIVECIFSSYKVRSCIAQPEIFSDIVLTGNFIGIIGSIGNNTIALRKASRNDTSILSGLMDSLYVFSFSDTEPGSMQHATQMNSDNIATASYCADTAGKFYTRIRHFNLQTMQMTIAFSIPLKNMKSEPWEMTYNQQFSTYLLLQDLPLAGSATNHECQVVTQRSSIPLSFESYYVQGRGFSSIASAPHGYSFILAGGSAFAFKKVWNTPSTSCFSKTFIKESLLLPVSCERVYAQGDVVEHQIIEWLPFQVGTDPPLLNRICDNNQ